MTNANYFYDDSSLRILEIIDNWDKLPFLNNLYYVIPEMNKYIDVKKLINKY